MRLYWLPWLDPACWIEITSSAIRSAQVSEARVVNVNLEPAPFPNVTELPGGAEVVLPKLVTALR